MKTSDVFPSRFVKAEDLDGDKIVTVEQVILEEVFNQQGNTKEQKPIIYFKGATKGMLLNKTNWSKLADAYGDESDAWKGQKCILTTVEVQAFGDVVSAIRIKIPNGK